MNKEIKTHSFSELKPYIKNYYNSQLKLKKLFVGNIGDFILLNYKNLIDNKEKIQKYKGIIISINQNISFTIYQNINGIKLIQTFLINSPFILSLFVLQKGRKKKSKLYFIKKFSEKKIKKRILLFQS
jgi:large subunit ribosomal protein L19